MAEAICKRMLDSERIPDVEVHSAGLFVPVPSDMSKHAISALDALGIHEFTHTATQLTKDAVAHADLILAMTPEHAAQLRQACPDCAGKINTLFGFAYGKDKPVDDPFGQPYEVYEACAQEIRDALVQVFQRLKEQQWKLT